MRLSVLLLRLLSLLLRLLPLLLLLLTLGLFSSSLLRALPRPLSLLRQLLLALVPLLAHVAQILLAFALQGV